mgnify:CR=1 FL=1
MIPLEDRDVMYLEDDIIQHIKTHPDAHHHTLSEMVVCCLSRTTQVYWLSFSTLVFYTHFSCVRNVGNQCKIESCFCSLRKNDNP